MKRNDYQITQMGSAGRKPDGKVFIYSIDLNTYKYPIQYYPIIISHKYYVT